MYPTEREKDTEREMDIHTGRPFSMDEYNYMQIAQLVVPGIFAVLVNFTLAAQQIAKITTLYTFSNTYVYLGD